VSTERVAKQLLLAANAAIISGIIIFTIIEVLHVNSVVFGMAVVSLTFAAAILRVHKEITSPTPRSTMPEVHLGEGCNSTEEHISSRVVGELILL
jgi:hypothetical protein